LWARHKDAAFQQGDGSSGEVVGGTGAASISLDQCGALWSRAIVRELILREFGVGLSLASVGALLSRLGLSPQKPLQRAYQRDPEAIERWKRETYPEIVRQAWETPADLYFRDESRFRADAVHGRTWGGKGRHRLFRFPANGKASARLPQSTRQARSGFPPARAE
jgi:hypothetical protein